MSDTRSGYGMVVDRCILCGSRLVCFIYRCGTYIGVPWVDLCVCALITRKLQSDREGTPNHVRYNMYISKEACTGNQSSDQNLIRFNPIG